MELKQWLDGEVGRAKGLADHLGVSPSMVSQMANKAVRIPPAHYLPIRDFTAGEVRIEDMLPPSSREPALGSVADHPSARGCMSTKGRFAEGSGRGGRRG
jgi:DNA-binding transcriptional regulator YdaS (Cro superfamily)